MAWIGQDEPSLVAAPRGPATSVEARLFVVASVAIAGLFAANLWGFTVDDALISLRYARHVAQGEGYRWNVHGPSTDGVTPLPWPWMLAPFARGETAHAFASARALGVVATLATAAMVGDALGRMRAGLWARVAAGLVAVGALPVAAYAGSGMETPWAVLLATAAAWCAVRRRDGMAALAAGLAATLRPELVVWAVTLALLLPVHEPKVESAMPMPSTAARRALRAVVALSPFVACAVVRLVVFGRPAPLAVLAKPSDAAHGLVYAAAGAVASGAPLLVLAPSMLRVGSTAAALALAACAHAVALAMAGGDWMPFARLYAPIVPPLALAFAASAPSGPGAWGRAALALFAVAYGHVVTGPRGRNVAADRSAAAQALAPYVAGGPRLACLDIGWPTLVTDGDIVDLAGLTDPTIAALAGGHTSKRVDAAFLLDRDPELLVLYTMPGDDGGRTFPRVVEARLAADPLVQRHFAEVGYVPLGATRTGYVVLRKRREP